MRLVWSGASEAGIAGLRVASSVRWAIRKDVYDAEAVTQVAEDRGTIEPVKTGRVADNRIGDTPFDGPPYPPVAPTTHHDQVRLELLGQNHDLQVHHSHPEVRPGHVPASGLHLPGQPPEYLQRLLLYIVIELAVETHDVRVVHQEVGKLPNIDYV